MPAWSSHVAADRGRPCPSGVSSPRRTDPTSRRSPASPTLPRGVLAMARRSARFVLPPSTSEPSRHRRAAADFERVDLRPVERSNLLRARLWHTRQAQTAAHPRVRDIRSGARTRPVSPPDPANRMPAASNRDAGSSSAISRLIAHLYMGSDGVDDRRDPRARKGFAPEVVNRPLDFSTAESIKICAVNRSGISSRWSQVNDGLGLVWPIASPTAYGRDPDVFLHDQFRIRSILRALPFGRASGAPI
jgi:hypothetical protein